MNQEKYGVQESQKREPQPYHYGHEHTQHPYYHTQSTPHGQQYVHHHYHHHYHYHMTREQPTSQQQY
jgi:hypothetical protein